MPSRGSSTRAADATFVDLLPLIARELHQRAFPKIRASGLTNAQFWILKWIDMHGPFTVSDLASYLGIRAPSVSPILDGLEGRDLIVRKRSATDRRVVSIRSTAHGKQVLRKAGDEVARLAAEATKGVPARDLDAAARVLRTMAEKLDSSSDAAREKRKR